MYKEGSQTTGHHRFPQHSRAHIPCPSQRCIHYEQPNDHPGGHGCPLASARQMEQSLLDYRRDIQAPLVKDTGARAYRVDRNGRSGHHSPQRRPVFTGPAPYSQSDDLSQICPWEPNPALWNYPPELGARHYLSVKEQCGCVVNSNNGAACLYSGIPHPLPHLRGKGHGYRRRRTVRYISMDEEEDCGCLSGNYQAEPNHCHMGNGHCGPRPVFFEGGARRDSHQDAGRLKGGSEETFNGCEDSHPGFFPTEVPQKHLNKQKVPHVHRSDATCLENSGKNVDYQCRLPEGTRQKRRKATVRDQIRQVVTDLEDVLGGLKQVHVEMKEVVEQIDRLTASIDLTDEAPCITQGSTSNVHASALSGDSRVGLVPNHKPTSGHSSQRNSDNHVILRTNSLSPVHMASVVKTNSFVPPNLHKDVGQERPGANGHLPHLNPTRAPNHTAQHPQTLDPKVIIENSTAHSKSQKPPLYPQNGRCGKSLNQQPKQAKTLAHPGRDRQSTSMV